MTDASSKIDVLSGDVSLNPGPRSCKFPCGTCGKPVRSNQAGIQCDSCDRWLHCKCINMSVREYRLLGSDHSEPWFCTTCVLPQVTDSFFNTSSDSAGDLTNEPEGMETLDSPNKITRKGSAGDLTNEPERTETLDSPNKITRKGLILAHLNISSLLAHLDELKAYLLYQRLDILSLTETKLDATVTNDELNIPGFSVAVRKDRTRRGGGVLCYARHTLRTKPRKTYQWPMLSVFGYSFHSSVTV